MDLSNFNLRSLRNRRNSLRNKMKAIGKARDKTLKQLDDVEIELMIRDRKFGGGVSDEKV